MMRLIISSVVVSLAVSALSDLDVSFDQYDDCYTDQIFCMEACFENLGNEYNDRTKRLACFSPCRDTFTKCLGEDERDVN